MTLLNRLNASLLLTCLLLFSMQSATAAHLLTPLDDKPKAPAFTLQDSQGVTHSLADYKGKVLVVNFWATWCPPCRKEMPGLNQAATWLKKNGVELIAINVGEKPQQVTKYLKQAPVQFPVLLDRDTSISSKWDAMRLPVTYVVDKDGRLAYRALGSREWNRPELLVPIRGLALER